MLITEHAALILLGALLLDGLIGDPPWLWRKVPHPVAVMGGLIDFADRMFNRDTYTALVRRGLGAITVLVLVATAVLCGFAIHAITTAHLAGQAVEALAVSILLAQRSLYEHVNTVYRSLADDDLQAARGAVALIVGRNPATLDEAAVCRASIESAAENFSDGIVAPAFWYLLFGLPGLLAYKMVNTADSMIGHRTARHEAFGWAAARTDDIANIIPARLAAVLLTLAAPLASGSLRDASSAVWRDAAKHRSPNAGWPEAAMAGALGLALAGPRTYGTEIIDDAWMNTGGRQQAAPEDIARALKVMVGGCLLIALALGLIVAIRALL